MQATAHEVAKSRTRLSDFTFTFHFQREAAPPEASACGLCAGQGGRSKEERVPIEGVGEEGWGRGLGTGFLGQEAETEVT